jgi:hypothetical protein
MEMNMKPKIPDQLLKDTDLPPHPTEAEQAAFRERINSGVGIVKVDEMPIDIRKVFAWEAGRWEKEMRMKPPFAGDKPKQFGEPTWGSDALNKYRITPAGCDAVDVLTFYQTLVDLGMDKNGAVTLTASWIHRKKWNGIRPLKGCTDPVK